MERSAQKNMPVAIHCGEDTDALDSKEIDQLLRSIMLKRSIVGVHRVAMSKEQAKQFAALILSQESNDFSHDTLRR